MSIKLYKVVPKPTPPPPIKFDLTGLTISQVNSLRKAIVARYEDLPNLALDEKDFLRRLIAVLSGTGSCTIREE
jgi:4-diphosphocytidyl-2C-methyl-D-erythritol kinase